MQRYKSLLRLHDRSTVSLVEAFTACGLPMRFASIADGLRKKMLPAFFGLGYSAVNLLM